MNPKTLTILLIEDAVEYADLVQHWLACDEGAKSFCLNWTDTLVGGLNRLAQPGVDVILLDLGLPDSHGLETFIKIRSHAPGIPIIILSATDSEALALQMIGDGAADYLVKNACNGHGLVRAVRYAVVRQRSQPAETTDGSSPGRRLVGILGAKGGVGATTISCHLALQLRRQTGHKVLLADLDLHAGLVAMMLGLDVKYSLLDAVQNIRHLDRTYWECLVGRTADDLHIIRSPGFLGEGELPGDAVRQVLTLVHPFYDWTVLDLGKLNPMVTRLVDRFTDLLIVTGSSLSSLYETKRVVDAVLKAGIDGQRLKLVFNQVDGEQPISGRELHKIFGIPVYATLNHDPAEAENAHKQLVVSPEGTPFAEQVAGLTRRIAGLPDKKSPRAFPRLLSFADRFRKLNKPGIESPGSPA